MHSANQPPPARLQLSRAKRSILQITKFTLQSNYSGLPCGQRLVSGYEILMSQLRAGLHWRHGCHHPAEGCHTSPPPPCDLVSLARCRRGCVPSNDPAGGMCTVCIVTVSIVSIICQDQSPLESEEGLRPQHHTWRRYLNMFGMENITIHRFHNRISQSRRRPLLDVVVTVSRREIGTTTQLSTGMSGYKTQC